MRILVVFDSFGFDSFFIRMASYSNYRVLIVFISSSGMHDCSLLQFQFDMNQLMWMCAFIRLNIGE